MLPELEKRGLVVRKPKSPRRFAPVKPQVAIQNLVTTKLKTMTGEIDQLAQCQDGLISKLKELELPFPLEDVSVDIITDHNIALVRLAEMTQKAQRQLARAAMWGGLQTVNRSFQNFWTNDPTQISILKTSFDNLRKKATRRKTLPQQRSRVTA